MAKRQKPPQEAKVIAIANQKGGQMQILSLKQLEKSKKSLENRLKKLNDQSRKDDVVTFEELGVDRLFVEIFRYVYEVPLSGRCDML